MNLQTLRKLIRKALQELEIEVLAEDPAISDEDLKTVLELAKNKILEEEGVSIAEYNAYEDSLKEIGKEKGRKKKEAIKQALQEVEERITSKIPSLPETLNTEAIRALIKQATDQIKPETRIIKETIREKPQIIRETIKEVDSGKVEELNKDIRELQLFYQDLLKDIQKEKDFIKDIDGNIKGKITQDIEKFAKEVHSKLLWLSTAIQNIPRYDLSGYVPYTGATNDVDLGVHKITANGTVIDDDITLKEGKKIYLDG